MLCLVTAPNRLAVEFRWGHAPRENGCILPPILPRDAAVCLLCVAGGYRFGGQLPDGRPVRAHLAWLVCPKRSAYMVRILITLNPRMYRETIALAILRHRPSVEVKVASPENAVEEVDGFRPHLLVRNDNDGLDGEVLTGVQCQIEVMYTDSMSARVTIGGRTEEISDMGTEGLLAVVDEAEGVLSPGG